MAELLAGNLKVHICYAVKTGRAATAVAQPDDPAMFPSYAKAARGVGQEPQARRPH